MTTPQERMGPTTPLVDVRGIGPACVPLVQDRGVARTPPPPADISGLLDTLIYALKLPTLMGTGASYLFLGAIDGLIFGQPLVDENEKIIGRRPGLLPKGADPFAPRFINYAKSMVGLQFSKAYRDDFFGGFAEGLKEELMALVDLVPALTDGTLFTLITSMLDALANDDNSAFSMGQLMGGGVVADLMTAAEGSDFAAYSREMGKLLGTVFLDIVGFFFSGGAGPLAKLGAKVLARLGPKAQALAVQLSGGVNKGLKSMQDVLLPGTRPELQRAYAIAANGVDGRMPDMDEIHFMLSNHDEAVQAAEASQRASRGAVRPDGAPDAPAGAPGFDAQGGLVATGTARAAREAAQAANPPDRATDIQDALSRSAAANARRRAAAKLLEEADAINLKAGKEIANARISGVFDAGKILETTAPDVEYGSFLAYLLSGKPQPDEFDDIRRWAVRAAQTVNNGAIHKMSVAVPDTSRFVSPFTDIEEALQPVVTHASGLLKPRTVQRSRMPNFNQQGIWPALIKSANRVNRELVRRGLLNKRPVYNAGHLFGPGTGGETDGGMGIIAKWVNQKLQAGAIPKEVMDGVSRSDMRKGTALAEFIMHRRPEGVGIEGFMIDYALAMEELNTFHRRAALEDMIVRAGGVPSPAQLAKLPPRRVVGFDFFSTSWGSELVDTDFFRVARELEEDIDPQHFTRSVEYHIRSYDLVGDTVVEVPGSLIRFVLDLDAPPGGNVARVTASFGPEGVGPEAFRDLTEAALSK